MRSALSIALVVSPVPAALSAQDFIHYKFDTGCTTEVINYATGAQALPANGVLETTSTTSPWTTGAFGTALDGGGSGFYNRVRTGWDPGTQPISGDLTIAFFMRETTSPGTSLSYLMGAPSGGIRMFTNGVAGRGLYQRLILASGGNGTNASIANDFFLPGGVSDVQTLAAAGWVHIAIVVDATAQTADWYVNGMSVLQLTGVVGGASLTNAGPFTVGYYSNASYYAFDEFFVSLRALTPTEVMLLSLSPRGGDGTFDSDIASQCGTSTLRGNGTAPSIGNSTYGLDLRSTATGAWSLNIGTSRCSIGGGVIPLPLDAGTITPLATGCWILTDSVVSVSGPASGGAVSIPLPIPTVANLAGTNLFVQGLALGFVPAPSIEATNGLAIGVGY